MGKLTFTLTEQEAVALRNLLNTAVQAGGMAAAEFAVPLDAKIREAAAKHEEERTLARARQIEAARQEIDDGNA